jgi:hypothetical protein
MECQNEGTGVGAAARIGLGGPCSGTGPYWPFPLLSPGDIHGLFLNTMINGASVSINSRESMQASLTSLAGAGLLSREDVSNLERLINLVVSEDDLPMTLRELRQLQLRMLTSSRGHSPLAAAIGSIAIDSLTGQMALGKGRGIFSADVKTGLSGAAIGAGIGGLGGAVVGGCIGAAAGSFGQWLDTRKHDSA